MPSIKLINPNKRTKGLDSRADEHNPPNSTNKVRVREINLLSEGQVHTSLSLSRNPVPDRCLTSPPGFARTHQHTTMYQQGPEAYAYLSLSLSRLSNALPKQPHRACHTWPKGTNIHPSILSATIIGVYSTARLETQHTHIRRSLSTTGHAHAQQLACLRH